METEEIAACIQALRRSNNGAMSAEVISAFIQSLKQSNEQPTSELEAILVGVEREARDMVRLYRL